MHGRSAFSAIRAGAVALALGLVQLTAGAVVWRSNTDFAWNTDSGKLTAFPGAGSGNIWASGSKTPGSSGPTWTGPAKQLPFNPSPTANFRAKFSAGKMAKALMRPAAGFAIPILAGSALKFLLDQACVRIAGGQMQIAEGGQWEECTFSQVGSTQYSWKSPPTEADWFDSLPAAWNSFAAAHPTPAGYSRVNIRIGSGTYSGGAPIPSDTVVWDIKQGFYDVQTDAQQKFGTRQHETTQPTGYAPADAVDIEDILGTKLQEWTQADFLYGYDPANHDTGAILDTILNSGNGVEVDAVEATGQSSVTGQPVTTTTQKPDGSTITNTTTKTTHVTYEGSSCTGAGSCTVTVTTTTSSSTTTTGPNGTETTTTEDPNTEEPTDECKKNPDRLNCLKLGETKAEDELSKDSKAWSFEPVSFGGGSCPSPVAFTVFGHAYSFSYGPLCDKLAMLAPLFLALATLAAAYIIADGFKVQ